MGVCNVFIGDRSGHRVLSQAIDLLRAELEGLEYIDQLHEYAAHPDEDGAAKCLQQSHKTRQQIVTLLPLLEGSNQTLGTLLQQIARGKKA